MGCFICIYDIWNARIDVLIYEDPQDPAFRAWKISAEEFYPDYWDHLIEIINADKIILAYIAFSLSIA